MESKPAVNGRAVPGEVVSGTNHLCQDVMPRKQQKAAGRDVGPDAPGEPSETAGSIAGVYVEASKRIMSFYEATREHLLSLDSALSLLEAQAATGSISDPLRSCRVPVAEAVRTGLVGLELKERLLSADRAATGFLDPYTEEKISLYQAMQKELVGREQGIRLLQAQVATGGVIDPATGARLPAHVACERGYLDEEMSQLASDPGTEDSRVFLDPSTMEKVTYSELRKRCTVDPASGFLLLPLQITFPGMGGRVSIRDLMDSGIISPDVFRGLEEGGISPQEVAENEIVQHFLRGTRSVAGVVLPSGEQKSLYQALREHLLVPGAALMLLQVQASTGSLTDPLKNKNYSVDEAVRVGLIGPELYEKLSSAEKAVTGYRDPSTGEMLSLFQAIRKGFVPRDHGLCLLEAQLATGGVIAPGRHLRVPMETALEWGYLDEATRQLLSSPNDDTKGFFDPSSKEKLSYAELLQRCVTDPSTGLLLLPLPGDSSEGSQGTLGFFDHRTQTALENTQVPVAVGKFKGKPVSLWKLLFSDYIQGEQRAALVQQFLAGVLSLQGLGEAVRAAVEENAATANVTFKGLREQVTADQLLSSEIINKDLFKKLKEGETSAKEVVGMDTVRKYLQGTGSIGGLLLPDSQEKISIYQAKRKGLLRPGTSLILLEAQAATGFVIDPAANKRYSVDEALRANVIGPDVYDKLLAAEKSVTGYRDPYSGDKISLFQAMQKELIVRDHGIRLLEAQIATGGIIDPVNSHRIPVEVAYKRGYFDKKMNLILSDPSDDTKGFFDPNTHENLTYLQLKEKCITEPSTGLCLLPLNSKKRQFVDEATRQVFRSSWLPVRFGRLRGEKVSVWDLLNSEYFSEGRRREIFNHFQLRKLSLEQIRLMLEEEMKKWAPIKFPAIRGNVSAYHLMETGVIDRALFEQVLEGSVTPEQVLHMDSVRKYLYGSGSIGGIVLQPSNQRMSIYEAMKQNIVVPGVALPLLEAQAATGFIIDPVNNQKLCVDEAVKEGVIGPEVHEKLQQAEGAVTGYKDPFTGKKIPLFQAMKKGLIADKQAMQLMEVQMATGGIIDPTCGHHIPLESAQQRGCLDEDTSKALSKPSDDHRVFCLPDSKESVTYAELIQHCHKDDVSGFHLLPLAQAAAPAYTDEQIQRIFKETMVKEKGVSLWELMHSGYFTKEQRSDFVEKFRSEELSLEQLVALVLRLVGEMEMKARTQISLEGLRGSVPVVWLLDTGIISQKTFEELAQGVRTPEEVAEMESVKRYLKGTGSIAGVFIEASKQKMSFYDAMKNNLLLPGAALRLLEAQAATGYLTDPATNRRLSVRDAVRAAVVGEELSEKLLQAERAVTGYTDPYTGGSISLCQALRKELIPLAEAVPLLEAQLATGGVVDPTHHLHLPLQAAYKYGFYDEELNQTLSQLDDSTKSFFDPNNKENVTYQQLKDRCIRDAESGLWLLPLSENAMFCVDEQTMKVLKSVTVCVNVGRFKGQTVSVWDLLNSEYFSDSQRRELVQKYKDEKAEVLQEITTIITTIIQETEAQGKKFAFKGLRKRVSASDLFQSQLIDKKTLDELNQGKKTVKEVTEMESVRRYLEGTNFIAGVLIQPSNEKMSIYQAMWKGILRPGTALVLLEAQAATGYIIDPEKNKKFSVEEALEVGLIGGEIFEKLLCAERAVTGYMDPYTKAPMSLFEAMNQGLIVKSHGIRLLEAQIATGGIIDPVHSHRVPVEVAYKRGYFDQEMNQILSDPSDDTKGFFDPNTHENLTYMQLLERCVQDPDTGLYMLQVVKEGGKYFYIDESTKQALRSKPLQVKVGKFKDQTVSVWEVLCSHYFSEQKRKELVMQYKSKNLALEELISLILKIIEDTERRGEALKVKGLRGEVSVSELFNSEIIDKKTLDQLQDGSLTLASLTKRDTIQRYLDGTGCIAGVLLPLRKEVMSIYQALKKGLLTEQCALGLLEAQAATGFLVDPRSHQKLSVDEAVSSGLVGSELREQLLSAEKAVTGYTDPQTGNKISLFQAVRQKVIVRDQGIRLLEAQIATGGIVDPWYGHRLPLEVAYKRGHLDEDMFLLLSDPDHGSKGFIDPNTHEKISYSQLLQRCAKDRESGLYLLQVLEKEGDYFYIDEQTKNALLCTKVQVPVGKYKGQVLSLWELLCSEYITEEKRKELVKKYKAESQHIVQGIIETILKIIREKEEDRSDVWFQGLRQQITASELLSAQIITEETIEKLQKGKETAQEIAKMESVRRYLEGTGSIAGVLVPSKADQSKMEKMSIYQAMWKGILRQGTALVLLEAQAATGFIVDPVKNQKLSVDEAVSSGLVGSELKNKLLSAERAVTGYTHPYTGQKMSLFQAMKQDLIVRDHGIRLLEAQIATGGIIDPVHSHRLPVEVAYKRGYFDQEMSQILSDPGDDTKGFFDPNTHENLTYLQLLRRCVPDPETGLLMLQLMDKGSVLYQLSEDARRALQAARTTRAVGLFQGQSVTIWELLFSRYVPEHRRQELLRQYKAGTVTIAQMIDILVQIITRAEGHGDNGVPKGTEKEILPEPIQNGSDSKSQKKQELKREQEQEEELERSLKSHTVEVSAGGFHGRKVSLWELLFSKFVSEAKRQELLGRLRAGSLVLAELATLLTLLVEEAAQRGSSVKFTGFRRQVSASDLLDSGIIDTGTLAELVQGARTVQEVTQMASVKRYLDGTGVIAGVLVPSKANPSKMEKMSIYQAMWKGILRQGTALVLLEAQAATGFLVDPVKNQKLSVDEAVSSGLVGSELHEKLLSAERAVTGYSDPYTGEKISLFQAMKKELIVRDHGIRLLEAQIATGGIIDPVHSHRLPVEVAYKRGYFDQEMSQILSDPGDDTKGFFDPNTHENLTYLQLLRRCVPDPETGLLMLQLMDKGSVLYQLSEDARRALQAARTTLAVGLFQGQSVTVWELLFSRYVPEHRRQELLRQYKAGTVTIAQMIDILVQIITRAESHGENGDPKGTEKEILPEPIQNGSASKSQKEEKQKQEQEEELERSLKSHTVEVSAGGFHGRKVSLWELLFSKFVSEAKRQELLGRLRAGSLVLAELATLLTLLVEEAAQRGSSVKFTGLRRQVSASDLLDSGIIDTGTLAELVQGARTVQEVTQMASVKRYLDGTGVIAGVLVPSKADPSKMEKMSIYQAMWKGILRQGTALVLLEAQAATGFLVDPVKNQKLSVDEAVSSGLVGSELHEKLLSAERAVTGYSDPYTGEKISLFQAMKKELIVRDHGIRLLEAQIATGGIIDPVHSHRLPVEVAYKRGYFDQEMSQILSDPGDDTKGFFDPNTHENLTYLQLLRRCVPDPETGLLMLQLMDKGSVLYQLSEDARRALQAAHTTLAVGLFQGQSVTVWELLFSRYVPEHRRQELLRQYKAGTVTIAQMIDILVQIITRAEGHGDNGVPKGTEKEILPEPIQNGSDSKSQKKQELKREQEQEEELERSLKSHTVEVSAGGFHGRKVSLWELLFSKFVSEAKRQELLGRLRAGSLVLAELATLLTLLVEEAAQRGSSVKFTGFRRQVSASDLLDSGIIDTGTLAELVQGARTVQEVTQMASVKRYLDGTGVIAGVLVPSKADPSKMEKMSIYQAMWKGILRQGTALVLLEAQAATGFLVDPVKNQKLSVDEAVSSGLVGSELHEKLLSAERAVTGYSDPYTGEKISLFQAMKKELIVRDHGIRLLEAQIATGGIIDPVHSHRLPVEVAYKRGYFDQEMSQILSDPGDDTKGFFDPNTHENLTYLQLLRRCVPDPETGLYFLNIVRRSRSHHPLRTGYLGQVRSPQPSPLPGQGRAGFKSGTCASAHLAGSRREEEEEDQDQDQGHHHRSLPAIQLLWIHGQEVGQRTEPTWGHRGHHRGPARGAGTSPRSQTPGRAAETPGIDTPSTPQEQDSIPETMRKMSGCSENNEQSSPGEHKEMDGDSGGSFIAGVFLQAKGKKLSIHEAMVRGMLSPGTALVLLEAQAASGLLTDPTSAARLSMTEALARGLVGHDFYEKLLSAEGAVTGYTEPYTGHRISLFQAMQKGLIVRDHGIRLLQAQIATGGIIDPTSGHRVPVEVAYKRGYFDEEMNQILSNPENQTRTCFDPNTHENLTYLQLLRRCVPDPETGLLMLQLMDKGSVLYQLSEDARRALQAARTTLAVGLFQGQSVTVWELLFSLYVPEHQREELLRRYKAGAVSIAQMIEVLTATITAAERDSGALGSPTAKPNNEARASPPAQDTQAQEQQLRKSLKSMTVRVTAGEFHGQNVSVLDLLFSRYVPQDKRQELLELYRAGILSTEQVGAVVTTMVNRTEAANAARVVNTRGIHRAVPAAGEGGKDCSEHLDEALRCTTISVPAGELQGQQVSLWDLIFSDYIPEEKREELLDLYHERLLTLEQMRTVVSTLIRKKESAGRKLHITVKSSGKDPVTAAGEEGDDKRLKEEPWKTTLQTTMVHVEAPEFQGRQVSLWDLLHSHYIPEENRRELLELYEAGELSLEQVRTVVTTIVTRTAAAETAETAAAVGGPRAEPVATEAEPTALDGDGAWEETLKATRAEASVGEFQDGQTSLWDLLFSEHIPEEKRQELLELYRGGTLPLEQLMLVVTTLIKKKESAGKKFQISVKSSSKDPVTAAGQESDHHPKEEAWKTTLKTTMVHVEAPEFQGRQVSLWDLLHSRYIPQENRRELLELYEAGELSLEQVRTVVTTIVTRTAAAETAETAAAVGGPRAEPVATEAEPTALDGDRTWEETLKATRAEVSVGEFQDGQTSLWDLLFSDYIPEEKRQELLELYRGGTLPLEQLMLVVTTLIKKKESAGRKFQISVKNSGKDPVTAAGQESDHHPKEEAWKTTLKTTMVHVKAPEFQGREVSLWDLLHSRYIPQENRRELLELYEAGELSLEQVKTVVTTIVTRTAAAEKAETAAPVGGPRAEPVATEAEPTALDGDGAWEETLKATRAEVAVGEFQGTQTSLWDLLFSEHIPEEKRQELLELYRGGTLPIQELLSTTSSLASQSLEQHLRALPAHTMDLLRSEGSYITCDPAQERRVSVWELLSSKQVSEYKREACLDTYPSGGLTVNRITITTTITTGPRLEQSRPRHH
ncbi:epiplakin [Passerculus sandwichensis]